MPGAGKSYWAEQIAAAFSLQCIDLDDMITVRTGHTISGFFERFGETSFRELEQQTLSQIITVFKENTVVACGGGTPCFYDNLAQMKQAGTVIYLHAPIETLIQHLESEAEQRPLLSRSHWQQDIEELLQTRKAIYEQANIILPAKSLSIADFASILNDSLL